MKALLGSPSYRAAEDDSDFVLVGEAYWRRTCDVDFLLAEGVIDAQLAGEPVLPPD